MRLTLAEAMTRAKLTPEEIAERSGVHRATVYRLKSFEITNPSSATVEALERALELKPGTLVFRPSEAVA